MNLNIMKEETLREVLAETKKVAAYTEILANGWELTDWASIQTFVRNGIGASRYPVGSQFVMNHSVWGTITWDVVGHDIYKKPGEPNAHTMTLLAHYRDKDGVQFDAPEAMYFAENGLPAGTYHFTATTYSKWTAGDYQFTLANPVPAGGQLKISGDAGTALTSLKMNVYADRITTAVSESVDITAGSEGTMLGTFESELNHPHRMSYGSNNYKESAIRQFLNSADAAGSVWKPQTGFDRPPSWRTFKAGFIAGLPEDFLAVVCEVDVPCKTNPIYEAPDSTTPKNSVYTVLDKFFLVSQKEVYGSEDNPKDGSVTFPYYEGASNADRIKYYMNNTANPGHWWVRTPNPSYAVNVRYVDTSGGLNSGNAYYSHGCVPACNIG